MIPQKPYAISCDRNTEPIFAELKHLLADRKALLEVAAGTGQHAISMAPHFLDMTWTVADRTENFEGISQWLLDFPRVNIRGPYEYEIGKTSLPQGEFDALFASNLIHMVSWETALQFFKDLESLSSGARVIFYGAFNYDGDFTSEGNKKFDAWLKEKSSLLGVRNFEDVVAELAVRKISLFKDFEMPANNRLLVFDKE